MFKTVVVQLILLFLPVLMMAQTAHFFEHYDWGDSVEAEVMIHPENIPRNLTDGILSLKPMVTQRLKAGVDTFSRSSILHPIADRWLLQYRESPMAAWFEQQGVHYEFDMIKVIHSVLNGYAKTGKIEYEQLIKDMAQKEAATLLKQCKNIDSVYLNKNYIPKDMADFFAVMDKGLSDTSKNDILKTTDLFKYYDGFGRWMRNRFGLWFGSRIAYYYTDLYNQGNQWVNFTEEQSQPQAEGIWQALLESYQQHLRGRSVEEIKQSILSVQAHKYTDFKKRYLADFYKYCKKQ